MNENIQCQLFIDEEVLSLSINGAFQQHQSLYKNGVSEDKKFLLRGKLREHLKSISLNYRDESVNEEQHIKYLKHLVEEMSTVSHNILVRDEFPVGMAQKALNLYLKYLWCLGVSTKLPHCPIDSTVLSEIRRNDITWTKIRTIVEYQSLVKSAKQVAGKESLADWELGLWNKKNKK